DIAYQDKTAYYTDNGIKITEDHIIRTDNLNGTTTITLVNNAEDDTAVAKKDGPVNPNLIDVYAHEINFGFPINLTGEPESSIIDLGWGGGGSNGTDVPQTPQDVAQVEDEPPPAVDPPAKDGATLAQSDEDAPSAIEEIIITGHKTEPNDALQALIDDANDPRSFVEKVADATTQMVGAAVDAVVETAADLGNAALQTVIDLIKDPSSLGEKVTNAAADTAKAVSQALSASASSVLNLDLGILKGLGNLPTDAWNLAVTAGKYLVGAMSEASTLDARALAAYNSGNAKLANTLAAQAEQLRAKGLVAGPFTLDNTAQKVGSLVSAVVPIGEVVKAAGVVGKTVQGADKLVDAAKVVNEAADVAKVVDEVGDAARVVGEGEVVIDRKIADQLDSRGWTKQEIQAAVEKEPAGTTIDNRSAAKTPDGVPRNDPASVYGSKDGYVVVNDRTGEVVQVSNKNNPNWIVDSRIQWE
ncbi:MAG: hypothetical protein LBF16_04810, partial [Pseudomonadales bacterium]|nr:hypothetical protein [Pseudomonadales bacterium]